MTVSFIIPTFNAHAFIGRCLESIFALEKELPDFEVIVIDDASTDDTTDVVRSYISLHPQIILVCQPVNHRVGAARNRGVSIARGEFIVFVDSDDEIAKGVLRAAKLAEEKDLDMSVFRYLRIEDGQKKEVDNSLPYDQDTVFTGIEMQTKFPFLATSVWTYLFRKSFLESVDYPFAEDVLFEDADFVNVHLYHAKRIAYTNECGYVYYNNAASITHTISYLHLADYVLLGTRMLSFYENLEDKTSRYAKSILEGGSFNVMKAFSRLYRLNSHNEVRAFYDRLDAKYNRKQLLGYREPAYCWTPWTRFCLKYRELTIAVMAIVIPLAKTIKKASVR